MLEMLGRLVFESNDINNWRELFVDKQGVPRTYKISYTAEQDVSLKSKTLLFCCFYGIKQILN